MDNTAKHMVSDTAAKLIEAQDATLNKRAGWAQNNTRGLVDKLLTHGRVEVGWREACGKTDETHHQYRAWVKVLKQLRKDGLAIAEERQKHGNGYATMKGGFWSSIVYTLEPSTNS